MSTEVEQIKERLDIVDVISSYLKVEKAGINFKARCPFHNEKTPSFFISPTRQSFYCFGCGEKGDVFSFVEKFENLDFKSTLKILADRAGIQLKNRVGSETENKDEKERLFIIMEEATKFYQNNLLAEKTASDYLKKRGLSENTIKKWRIGFAKDEWRNLYDFLVGKNFLIKEMIEAGLTKKTLDADKYYDTFRNRIMFPIFDNLGRVVAFSGRAMKEDEKVPKYLNSPETKLFYKSETLYGFHIAKNYIRKMDYAVIVEGQMDLLMSHQAGIFNTIASSGTALTELHLKKIQKLSNRVVLAYDSDEAGDKATKRAAEMALILGMEVKKVSLPKGEDPDSIIRKSPQIWKEALKEAEYFTDFILNKTLKENEGSGKLGKEIIKNVLPIALLIKDKIEQTRFVKKISLKINVGESDVRNDMEKIKTDERQNKNNNVNQKDQKEELRIEMEKFGIDFNVEEANEQILKIRMEKYKKRRREIANKLDGKNLSSKEKEQLEKEYKENEKNIKELNN